MGSPNPRLGPTGEQSILDLISTSRELSCTTLITMYGVLHEFTSVQYHVLSLCLGGNWCRNGKIHPENITTHDMHWTGNEQNEMKYNWHADVTMDASLVNRTKGIIAAAMGATSSEEYDEQTRVAPFRSKCF